MSVDGLDVVELGTAPGPLLEGQAWHSWVGRLGHTSAMFVAGPTRRPGRDFVLWSAGERGLEDARGSALHYVRSWPHEPDDVERRAVFERFLLELRRARAQLGAPLDLDGE